MEKQQMRISPTRVPLILASGGLDSTWLLYERMQHTDVDILYVRNPQDEAKAKVEMRALAKITDWLERAMPHRVRNFYVSTLGESNTSDDTRHAQVLSWVQAAMLVGSSRHHTSVEIGYVQGDTVAQKLPDIIRAWDALKSILKLNPVDLVFPLAYVPKSEILRAMQSELLALVWYCDYPGSLEDGSPLPPPCNECPSCIRHQGEVYVAKLKADLKARGVPDEISKGKRLS